MIAEGMATPWIYFPADDADGRLLKALAPALQKSAKRKGWTIWKLLNGIVGKAEWTKGEHQLLHRTLRSLKDTGIKSCQSYSKTYKDDPPGKCTGEEAAEERGMLKDTLIEIEKEYGLKE